MLTVTLTKISFYVYQNIYEQQYRSYRKLVFLISRWWWKEKKLSFETPEYVYVSDLLYLKICIEKSHWLLFLCPDSYWRHKYFICLHAASALRSSQCPQRLCIHRFSSPHSHAQVSPVASTALILPSRCGTLSPTTSLLERQVT